MKIYKNKQLKQDICGLLTEIGWAAESESINEVIKDVICGRILLKRVYLSTIC